MDDPFMRHDDATPPQPGGRIDRFLAGWGGETPIVVIDLEAVRGQCLALRGLMPAARIFYAVKANPAPEIIAALAALGVHFDVASEGEIERCRDAGVAAERISFGNTIKRETDIAAAHATGVALFAFDSLGELEKLARAAPGSGVYCRLLVENVGAQWPLTRKFGCSVTMAEELLLRARTLGLRPLGVSFHVGSQQVNPQEWPAAIAHAAGIFRTCARQGLDLTLLNLGGGLPAHYDTPVPPLAAYVEAIDLALTRHFGGAWPQILIEPGRYMVGDAGLLRSRVLLVARKSPRARERWVYLDAGRYNGLPETLGERIRYRIRTPHDGTLRDSAILAGPTCDSANVLYRHSGFTLPADLAIGDPVDFLSAGAYTASYASVEFNGFPPIRCHCI